MEKNHILYKDSLVEIIFSLEHDGHYIVLGSHTIFLTNGCLEELAKTDITDLKGKITAISPLGGLLLERHGVSYERLSAAIAKARNMELEQELRHAYAELD